MKGKYLLDREPPSFWVMDLGADRVQCWVAGWTKGPSDSWAIRDQSRKNLSKTLKQAGISFQSIRSETTLLRPPKIKTT